MITPILNEITDVQLEVLEDKEIVSYSIDDEDAVNMKANSDILIRTIKNYDLLSNRPSINEHLLVGGENSLEELGIGRASNSDIARLFS